MPESTRKQRRARKSRRRIIWWSIAGALALVLGAGGVAAAVLGPKALAAREALTSSVPLVSDIQADVLAGNTEAAQSNATTLVERTAEAKVETSGSVWRTLESVPWVGANLHAVRVAADVTHQLATDAVVPLSGLSLSMLTPVDGAIDLDAVATITQDIADVGDVVSEAQSALASIDRAALIPQVASGIDQLDAAVNHARDTLVNARPLLDALPGMLGADGPRDVLVIFQNNGEVMPGGGTIGSLAQLHIDRGKIEIAEQASAADFPPAASPVVDLPPGTWDIYGSLVGRYVQSLTRTPRMDVTFDIAREMWRLKTGVTVDAVVAVDVVALSQVLQATGPVHLADGLTLDHENAIPLLLGDLYRDYEPLEVDAINQAFASLVMSQLFSGEVSAISLVSSLGPSIEQGRIRIWSSREAEQVLISGSPFDRRGPEQTAGRAEVGVYFMDATPGKMQRFMTQAVSIENVTCTDERVVRVTVELTNTVDPASVSSLPTYVTGSGSKTPKGTMRLSALMYSPRSFELRDADWDGPAEFVFRKLDGELTVEQAQVLLAPGETRRLVVDYEVPDTSTVVGADLTPVVMPTTLAEADACHRRG